MEVNRVLKKGEEDDDDENDVDGDKEDPGIFLKKFSNMDVTSGVDISSVDDCMTSRDDASSAVTSS